MEIITYVRKGAISHEDDLGNRGRTEAGDVHIMSAGTGVHYYAINREAIAAQSFEIWIEPSERGGAPRWGYAGLSHGKTGRPVCYARLRLLRG